MKKTEAMRAIVRAYTTLAEIDDAHALKRAGLTLAEYDAARDIFNELSTPGSAAETFIKGVAAFYRRAGFIITETAIGYRIATN